VHYKSQPNDKTPGKTRKSTNVKSLTKIVRFQQLSELDRISHGADVVGQSIPGGRTAYRQIYLSVSVGVQDVGNK